MDSTMRPAARGGHLMRYVILGNSTAGIAAAQEIRRHDPEGRITIVSDEKIFGYSRAMLSLYIAGKKTKRDIVFAPGAFYTAQNIRLLKGETATTVDAREQQVHLGSGKRLPYDRLLVATGSSSRALDVPGKELPGIFPLRKITDADAIKKSLRSSRGPVVIVGGGLVGVKSLEALASKKREIHLVISSDRILSQMLDRTASDFFLRAFERHGVQVHFHTDVTAFHGGEEEIGGCPLASVWDKILCGGDHEVDLSLLARQSLQALDSHEPSSDDHHRTAGRPQALLDRVGIRDLPEREDARKLLAREHTGPGRRSGSHQEAIIVRSLPLAR